jgi:plastocyanin
MIMKYFLAAQNRQRVEIVNSKYLGVIVAVFLAAAYPLQAKDLPTYSLSVKDGKFAPEKVEVPAGQKFKLVVKNEGSTTEEFESSDLNREKLIPPGQSAVIFIGPLKAGSYGFYGEFHPQTARGQIIAK